LGNSVSIGQVGVIDLETGNKVSVAVTSIANSYLTGISNPLQDLRALTVADYTFLVNKKKEVKRSLNEATKSRTPVGLRDNVVYNNDIYTCLITHTSTSTFQTENWRKTTNIELPVKTWQPNTEYSNGTHEALIVVKLGDYEKNYDIYIDDQLIPFPGSSSVQSDQTPSTGHTYESGNAQGSKGGEYADTAVIAEDLESCLNSFVNTFATGSGYIESIDIINGGSGWIGGQSSGRNTTPGWDGDILEFYHKVEVEITQAGNDSKALAELRVVKGIITEAVMLRGGNNFNPSLPFNYEYKGYTKYPQHSNPDDNYYELVPRVNWLGQVSGMYGTTPTISPNVSGTAANKLEIDRQGSVIKITSSKGPFKIRTEDGLSNQALGVVHKEVSSITDLPKHCYNNFIVKVIGDVDISQDDYYVIFSTKENDSFGEGSWIETVGFYQDKSPGSLIEGIDTAFKSNTMPVTLVPYLNNNGSKEFRLQTPNELLIVKHNSNYYRLDKTHTSSSNKEPGTGADWEEFWTEVPSITQGYLEWKNGTYYLLNSNLGWAKRGAGDDNTNPFPSFVGGTINDVFFFKNRLGFLTDSNVIFSEADEYFNFFRTTTQQLLDSAPIDVGLSHTKVAVLQHAVPFQEKLMLFSKQSQFVLRGADVLSPKTVAISPVTEYDISDTVEPIALGNYIYFTFKRNDFEGMYEYFVDNNTETFHSEEITSQIPKYITADVKQIAGSQSENTIVVGTSKDPKTLFVYKYFWSNKEKIQSAWMKFTFGRDVRGFDFIDSNLHMLTADSEGLHLESLTLEDGLKDTNLDYTLYLDSRVDGSALTTSYDAPSKTTTISGFPFDPVNVNIYTKKGHKVAFTKTTSTAGTVSGTLANYVTHSGTIYKCETTHTSPSSFVAVDTSVTPNITYWTVSTDVATAPEWVAGKFYNNEKYFFAGIPYNMLYRFSDQTLKQPTERGGRSASDYAFQTIRNGSIDYAETGHFTVEVTPKYRDTYSYAFNPDIVGANLTLNTFTPQSGHFRFPVQAQPNEAKIEVVTDSALPVKLLAAEFESMMIPRSRRYGA
jgi:hypothetical protein